MQCVYDVQVLATLNYLKSKRNRKINGTTEKNRAQSLALNFQLLL